MADEAPREKPSAEKVELIEKVMLDALYGDELANVEIAANSPFVWNILHEYGMIDHRTEPLFNGHKTSYTKQEMLTILLHSSKTMVPVGADHVASKPQFLEQAQELQTYISRLSPSQLMDVMHISQSVASQTATLNRQWGDTRVATPAVETFRGDIYSGLRALDWSLEERAFAQDHLRILSGLYGILRPLDGIAPYRLEAGYRLEDEKYKDLYKFWGSRLAETLPKRGRSLTSHQQNTQS